MSCRHLSLLARSAICLVFLSLLSFVAIAQTPNINAPFSLKAPSSAHWTVTYRYKGEPELPPEQEGAESPAGRDFSRDTRIRSIKVSKTPSMLYEETRLIDGKTQKRWRRGNIEVIQVFGEKDYIVIDSLAPNETSGSKYHITDFPELRWLRSDNYVRTEKSGDRELLVFTDNVVDERSGGNLSPELEELPPLPPVSTTAWIDKASRLPVRYQRDNLMLTYRFLAPTALPPIPTQAKYLFDINESIPEPGRKLTP